MNATSNPISQKFLHGWMCHKFTRFFFKVGVLSLLIVLSSSCRSVRNVEKGQQALWETKLRINGKKSKNRQAFSVIRQQPAPRKIFGYKPEILDTNLANRSARQLKQYAINNGFFQAEAHYEYESISSRKARITYHITTGPRFIIKNLKYSVEDPALAQLAQGIRQQSPVKIGAPFRLDDLEKEREMLTTHYRNQGYFGFPRDLIRYSVDTIGMENALNLEIIITNRRVKRGDTVVSVDPVVNQIARVVINPDFRNRKNLDTIEHRGYELLFGDADSVWISPRVLTDVLEFTPGSRYREDRVKNSYQHINRLRMFSTTELNFSPLEGDTTGKMLVANVSMIPLPRRSFTAQIEALNTSAQLGTNAYINWINRNMFGGGENLNVRLRGGIESQAIGELATDQFFNTFELSFEASLLFPRFLLPFNTVGLLPKRMQPRTRISASAGRQSRVEFDRILYRTSLGYLWQESLSKSHALDIIDLNIVQITQLRDDFLQNLNFLFGFRNTFISSTRYTYTYNDQITSKRPIKYYFRGMVEVAGNTLSGLDAALDFPVDSLGAGNILGINYAQYIKFEADYRQFWIISPKTSFVVRAFGGYTRAYGNSVDPVFGYQPPFEMRYFAGGSNDLRAFLPYRLGPGNNPDAASLFNTAPIKVLSSVEYRFPIYEKIRGALFADAGNIFYENLKLPDGRRVIDVQPDYVMRWEGLLSAMALGSGFGLRYDFGFFVIRLDAAYPIYNPTETIGSRWVNESFRFSRIVWNVALGYPF
ncbi:MAG: BamA/TamA family outer membrane protein [Cryomorphaceae bacterium]|nr:BamA/TamA family outer membrane protein [Cryomorphaceae bacterium]